MRDEEEIREQYEFLKEQLDDENMRHEGSDRCSRTTSARSGGCWKKNTYSSPNNTENFALVVLKSVMQPGTGTRFRRR
ncbi:hypothetical protein [Halorussus caseinilyticus]|uniref:Uncharacterized protein n=1 Tax=Halorussus caseinilyticus TaxID=3034025 RepID=A0ABD5WPN7_9EURY